MRLGDGDFFEDIKDDVGIGVDGVVDGVVDVDNFVTVEVGIVPDVAVTGVGTRLDVWISIF